MKKRLQKVTNCILSEEPIILPTDTVYGLLCKYNSKKAVERIYKFKKRENNKPLICLAMIGIH